MLTKYRFEMEGVLLTDDVFPLKVDDYFIDFDVKDGKVIAIEVFEPTDLSKLPTITAEKGKINTIEINGDNILKIRAHLKLAEGLLSAFGVRSIDLDNYTIKWIPANEEEKKLLDLYEFSFGYQNPDEHREPVPFSLIAQSIISGFKNSSYEVSLSFYRKGKVDMAKRDYIDAFYDFYFVLESLFGEGKTKNTHIEKNLLASEELANAIVETKKKEKLIRHVSNEITNPFDYIGESFEEIVKHIVRRRGFLHHHNPKHPKSWNPDMQKEFNLDAAFLMDVSHNLIWEKVTDYIYDDGVVSDLNASYKLGRKA